MVAWVRYLNHARREKAEQQLELALSKKDQELQKLRLGWTLASFSIPIEAV